MWIKDPKSGEKSVTLTAFVVGFSLASFKLICSGVTLGTFTSQQFTGGDFAAVVAAVGGLYWARRNATTGAQDNGQTTQVPDQT